MHLLPAGSWTFGAWCSEKFFHGFPCFSMGFPWAFQVFPGFSAHPMDNLCVAAVRIRQVQR